MFKIIETNYELRNEKQLEQPKVNTETFGIKSFRYQGAKVWNTLPNHVQTIDNPDDFKQAIKDCLPKPCTCNSCVMCKINSM